MNYQTLLNSVNDGIATVTINRPDKLNALNTQSKAELKSLFTEIKSDNSIDVIILTGAGEKAFVAGTDIKELTVLNSGTGKEMSAKGQEVFDLIENLGKPVIAAVNGYALGGGCELALACHIRIASENAKFGQPEVNLGIIPGYGGTQRLARLVGRGRALQLLLTGEMIDAAEAFRLGLVNRVVPAAENVTDAARSMLRTMLANGPGAVAACIAVVNRGLDVSLEEALALEAAEFGRLAGTADMREGTEAFLEKRAPNFRAP